MLNAYFIIKNYPMHASDLTLEEFIKQQHKVTLKDLCIKLLLSMTFYSNEDGDLVLLFKDPKHDQLASLVTYGTGAIPGSKILQIALKN